MKLCAYCIDIRNSTELLTIHQKQTSGKIHKAFLTIASRVVLENGGEIRSFTGDGLLAFWPAYQNQITTAVKCAMTTKWLLDIKLSPLFEKYKKIDFGSVNFATAIANQAKSPYHVEISRDVYPNLEDDWIYGHSNRNKVNMWEDGVVEWKGDKYESKITNWYNQSE